MAQIQGPLCTKLLLKDGVNINSIISRSTNAGECYMNAPDCLVITFQEGAWKRFFEHLTIEHLFSAVFVLCPRCMSPATLKQFMFLFSYDE